MNNDIEAMFTGIMIGIVIGAFLCVISIAYQMNEKATKTEVGNKVIYSYSWEVFKK